MTLYPPFAYGVMTDVALFTVREGRLHVLLRKFLHMPEDALPGRFIESRATVQETALRSINQYLPVGVDGIHLEQLATYGDPGRIGEMRVFSIAHVALAPNLPEPTERAFWRPVGDVIPGNLAYDHGQILTDAIERVRAKLEYTTLATAFLPEVFTLGELRAIYSEIWGTRIESSNFRRKVLSTEGFVVSAGRSRSGYPGPPAQMYRAGSATEIVPPFSRAQMLNGGK